MKKGVILLNLGGPDRPEAVRPFLYNLFSDRDIIRLGPRFLQKPLAYIISALRSKKSQENYKLIGGISPLKAITEAQADALRYKLKDCSVYIGMRYWHPLIEEAVEEIKKDGITHLLALCLYPHYSIATSGSSINHLKRCLRGSGIFFKSINSWPDNPYYIKAIRDNIKRALEKVKKPEESHILFSAHNLPISFIEKGDPYVKETMITIKEVMKEIHLPWHLSYQSKSGPVKWLTPSTEEKLKELASGGVKEVIVIPISFVSDHIETLYEIDIYYKDISEKLGITLVRTESLNTNPLFIEALYKIIIENMEEVSWQKL
ncbi:MAG: ferrochelatase [Thermodesulfovibrionales bacterium]|nr:ferrochelatase [Thermodesulfovibrionales bacterium]